MRRGRRTTPPSAGACAPLESIRHGMALVLVRLPEPYDFALSTERFRAFGVDLANLWHEGGLHRVVGGREVRIEAAPGGVDVEPLDAAIEREVLTLLGLAVRPRRVRRLGGRTSRCSPRLRAALAGFRPPLAPDPFEALVTSITAQQVSLHSAFAIRSRLIERFGEPGELAYAFPTRERLADASEDELVALGFSRRKAEYVIGLARADLDLDALAALPDEEVTERLVAIRGLGEWTADWFLARHLARPHAWPAGDLGLRKAVAAFYGDVQDVRELRRALPPVPEPVRPLPPHRPPRRAARMNIRHATDADRDELSARSGSVWQAESRRAPPWADASWEANEPEIERAIDANGLFVAEEDGRAVGLRLVAGSRTTSAGSATSTSTQAVARRRRRPRARRAR